MGSHEDVAEFLRNTLTSRSSARGVPAAAVAVVVGDEIVDHAVGVLHTGTGVAATPDSVFQIGSITKVWTATLVLQLVDEGLIELDAPVRSYLPEFRLRDDSAAGTITVRQLLSHQAGFEGDVFTDTGRGDDAIAAFVSQLADTPQIFTPGAMFSYNNAGYIVLGLLIERTRQKTWEQAVLDHIAAPLGLQRVCPSPYEAVMHRVAMGHVGPGTDGIETPAPLWAMARSNEPAGSMLAMTAHDLAGFARMHLNAGLGADGTVLLSPASVQAMSSAVVPLPRLAGMGAAWGLGWEIDREGEPFLYGHDGTTIGQSSYLRIAPRSGAAVVLLTNGGDSAGLFHDIVDPLLTMLTGTGLPARPEPPASEGVVDAAPFVGVYANSIVEMEFSQDAQGQIWLDQRPADSIADLGEQASRTALVPFEEHSLITRQPRSGMNLVFAFLAPDETGRYSYVHFGRVLARST